MSLIAYHPTAMWNWPSWTFPGCQSLVILERLASYHPAFPFHAWLTHPDLWKTVGTKRTHFSFHYLCAYVEALGRQTYTKILTQ